jgi:small subunit ribosomal protein S7
VIRRAGAIGRRVVAKRKILGDPKYGDILITRFLNVVMRQGKKAVAVSIVYGSVDTLLDRTREDPVLVFRRAVDNTKPSVEVKSRRVVG